MEALVLGLAKKQHRLEAELAEHLGPEEADRIRDHARASRTLQGMYGPPLQSSFRRSCSTCVLSFSLACATPEPVGRASADTRGAAGSGNPATRVAPNAAAGTAGAASGESASSAAPDTSDDLPASDAGQALDPCAPTGAPLALPLVVDDHFVASGYFAGPDAVTAANLPPPPAPGAIVEEACDERPDNPAGHFGDCHRFTFQALATAGTPPAAFGGVFWQGPANNWGALPGFAVAPGAVAVRFRAWGAAGGEAVSFNAGGINDPNLACRDSVDRGGPASAVALTLTTTPADYSIPLTGETYESGVIGAFNWAIAVTSTDARVSFFVDDIRWTAD